MNFTNKEAVAKVVKFAREYKNTLANTKILVIYRDRNSNNIRYMEIIFRPSNFQHLTGLLLIDKQGKVKRNCSVEFYHKCTGNNLKDKEIMFKPDGTTPLKLDALSSIMDLTKITRIVGDYNNTKKWLDADMVVGGVNYCLAVSRQNDNTFFPRSGLLEDIRQVSKQSSQVLAIYQKNISEKNKYKTIRYIAKGLNLKKINYPDEIKKIIY